MTLYCSLHEFTEATHIAQLRTRLTDLNPLLLCDTCGRMMGGTAYAEQPRPLRFMEAEVIESIGFQQRMIARRAKAAQRRLDRPTPTEIIQAFEGMSTIWGTYFDTVAAAFRHYGTLADSIAAAFDPTLASKGGHDDAPREP